MKARIQATAKLGRFFAQIFGKPGIGKVPVTINRAYFEALEGDILSALPTQGQSDDRNRELDQIESGFAERCVSGPRLVIDAASLQNAGVDSLDKFDCELLVACTLGRTRFVSIGEVSMSDFGDLPKWGAQ